MQAETDRKTKLKRVILTSVLSVIAVLLWLGIWFLRRYVSTEPVTADTLKQLKLPPGFQISLYAHVPNARQLAAGPDGLIFVGSRENTKVHVIDPKRMAAAKGDAPADSDPQVIALDGFERPNGVAYKDGTLYVAEVSRILKIDDIAKTYQNNPTPKEYIGGLPSETHHGWKYIRFSPDGTLYTAQGMPCNVCEKDNPIYGTILSLDKDKKWKPYASGVRNSVGFDWQPGTGDLWFTDNGRDFLGDDLPPDELNHATKAGLNFGFPYRYGDNAQDPDFGSKRSANLNATFVTPAAKLGAHVASLGMRFNHSKNFPAQYKDSIFIAEHGSWNRSQPIGYRVMRVHFADDGKAIYEPFITGWQKPDGAPWGRPVDLEFIGDDLFISDDFAGLVYKVSYVGEK